jgi:hypothetical protein
MYFLTPVERSHSNSSVSVTIRKQSHLHMNFLSSQRPVLSPPTVLTFSLNHLVYMSIDQKKYSNNNYSASPVFLIHVFIAVSYHRSHNVMLKFFTNIVYLLNCINHPNFYILSASNYSVKVKVKFSLYKPWRHRGRVQAQQRLTVSGAIPPLPILMACTGMTLCLP